MAAEDYQITHLLDAVARLQASLDDIGTKLNLALQQQARHDEQIKDLQDRGKWAGGIFSAVLIYIMTKIGLPHI